MKKILLYLAIYSLGIATGIGLFWLFLETFGWKSHRQTPDLRHIVELENIEGELQDIGRIKVVNSTNGETWYVQTDLIQGVVFSPNAKFVYVQRIGGNAAGWGIYRLNLQSRQLNYWDANARELELSFEDSTLLITATYAQHAEAGGYLPDKVKTYRWPPKQPQPE